MVPFPSARLGRPDVTHLRCPPEMLGRIGVKDPGIRSFGTEFTLLMFSLPLPSGHATVDAAPTSDFGTVTPSPVSAPGLSTDATTGEK